PVLIMAGRNDPRCPIRQIENYVARLTELGKVHEYYEVDAGHSSAGVDEQIRQMEKRIDFVHRHPGAPPPLYEGPPPITPPKPALELGRWPAYLPRARW